MKRQQSGFTLIELIIVIVILGILAITAAPRFFNFGTDARASTLNGLKGALESASSLVYGKAVIAGLQNANACLTNAGAVIADSGSGCGTGGFSLVNGYPAADSATMIYILELAVTGSPAVPVDWTIDETATNSLFFQPSGYTPSTGECRLTYTEAGTGTKPTLVVSAGGC